MASGRSARCWAGGITHELLVNLTVRPAMDNLEYAKALRARTSSKGALARSRQLQCIPIEESLAALPMWAKLGTKLRGVFLKMLRMRKGGLQRRDLRAAPAANPADFKDKNIRDRITRPRFSRVVPVSINRAQRVELSCLRTRGKRPEE